MKSILILFIFPFLAQSQTKGIVQDSLTGQPIPYVNIWVEGENTGTTSEENGTFVLEEQDQTKLVIFSILGYQKKRVPLAACGQVKLQEAIESLPEIVITKTKNTKTTEIGILKNSLKQAFENGPKWDIKWFPYEKKYQTTPYLKKIAIHTDSKIENATLKLHLYLPDANGLPGKELLNKDVLITVKKGIVKNSIDLSDQLLKFPEKGLFVAFEKLLIAHNKLERQQFDYNTQSVKSTTLYFPFILYNYNPITRCVVFSGGSWRYSTEKEKTDLEPAISLILSN